MKIPFDEEFVPNEDSWVAPETQAELAQLARQGKVNELMDEALFWQIIEKSRDFIYDTYQQQEFLALYLERFTLKQIIGFRLTTQKLIFEAYNQKSWYAGTILNEMLYDIETFEGFLCLVISRGKAVYQAFLQNPDSLIDDLKHEIEFYNFDHFHEASMLAFTVKSDRDIDEFMGLNDSAYSNKNYPEIDVDWEVDFNSDDLEEQLQAHCPRLYEKYWKNKNNEKNELKELGKVSEPMDETLFWQIIEKSRDFIYDQYKQEEFLTLYLDLFNLQEIIGFRLATQKLIFKAYNEKSWYAGSVLNNLIDDVDDFESFLCLVISRGKAVYEAFLQNPDSLIDDLTKKMDFYEFDRFQEASEMAFHSKTDADIHEFIDFDSFAYSKQHYPEIDVDWEGDSDDLEEQLQAHCPRLYEKYWENKSNEKIELKELGKVSEPMDEALFWQIIGKSRDFIYDQYKQEEFLGLYLDKFSLKEIIGFRLTTQKLIFEAYNLKSWYAGVILNHLLDDVEEFEAFLCFVISRGKAVYEAFVQNPDSLIEALYANIEFYDFDSFNEPAETVFSTKANTDISEFIDFDNFAYSNKNYPTLDVRWGDDFYLIDVDDQIRTCCPKLYEKYWNEDIDEDEDDNEF